MVSIDLFSRRLVGWTLAPRMCEALVIEALCRTLGHRQVAPDQLLNHAAQGSRYPASDYRDLLRLHEIVSNMSASGCSWDNAVVESFSSTMMLELDLDDHRDTLISPQQLQRDRAFWIKGAYNRERRHSTLGHFGPIDYEQQLIAARKPTPAGLWDLATQLGEAHCCLPLSRARGSASTCSWSVKARTPLGLTAALLFPCKVPSSVVHVQRASIQC